MFGGDTPKVKLYSSGALLKIYKFVLLSGGKQETHTKEKYQELKEKRTEKSCSLILSRSLNADV